MQLFSIIEDAFAIVRGKNGVFKQVKIYGRGDRVYVGAAGGFVRVVAKFGESWGTSHPDIKVMEMSACPAISHKTQEPRYVA